MKELTNNKEIVININCCSTSKEQNEHETNNEELFENLLDLIIEEIYSNKVFPKTFTENELKEIAISLFAENLSYDETKSLLESFYSIKSEQLGYFLTIVREQAIEIFKDSPFDLSEYIAMLKNIEKATDTIIEQCQRKYGKAFQVAALLGLDGVQDIVDDAFEGNIIPKAAKADCGSENYPYLFSMGIGIPYSAWSVSTRKRLGSKDGCNFHHYAFKHNISRIMPISVMAIVVIASHGLGGKLYGQSRALYYRIAICMIFLFTPIHIVNLVKTKK